VRYLDANSEDHSVCSQCYQKEVENLKYHVFFKLDRALLIKEQSQTPKILVNLLDPLLYPFELNSETDSDKEWLKKPSKGVSRELESKFSVFKQQHPAK